MPGLWGRDLARTAHGYQCWLNFFFDLFFLFFFILRVGRLKKQPCVIGGVVIDICIVIGQGETVRPGATIIGVEDNEVDYLFRHLTFGVSVAR